MLRAVLRNQLRRSLFLIRLRHQWRGEEWRNYIARKGATDICIDGFPRSANSFCVRMFRLANPDSRIAHHTHSIANLRYSINHDIPAVVLIRHPLDAIPSSAIAHGDRRIDLEAGQYVNFYDWVSRHLDRVVVAEFDAVISDMNAVIQSVNGRFGTTFSRLDDIGNAEARVKRDIERRFDRLGQVAMSHMKPIPTQSRSAQKTRLREDVAKHPTFEQAKLLYKFITSAGE